MMRGTTVIATLSGTFATIASFATALSAEVTLPGYFGVPDGETLTVHLAEDSCDPLNLTVDITIDPTYATFLAYQAGVPGININQKSGCSVNNPASPMYGYVFIANFDDDSVSVYDYDPLTNTQIFITTIGIAAGSFPNGCCYDSTKDQIYIPCAGSSSVQVITNTLALGVPIVLGAAATGMVFSPVNNCKYVTQPTANQVQKISALDVASTIFATPSTAIAVNTYNGDVWLTRANGERFVIDIADAIIISDPAGTVALDGNIDFYPATSAATARFMIASVTDDLIESWNAQTYAIVSADFIPGLLNPRRCFYVSTWDRFAIATQTVDTNNFKMYLTSGVIDPIGQPDTINGLNTSDIFENVKYEFIARLSGTPSPNDAPNIEYINVNFEEIIIESDCLDDGDAENIELRSDGGFELRSDGGFEIRS